MCLVERGRLGMASSEEKSCVAELEESALGRKRNGLISDGAKQTSKCKGKQMQLYKCDGVSLDLTPHHVVITSTYGTINVTDEVCDYINEDCRLDSGRIYELGDADDDPPNKKMLRLFAEWGLDPSKEYHSVDGEVPAEWLWQGNLAEVEQAMARYAEERGWRLYRLPEDGKLYTADFYVGVKEDSDGWEYWAEEFKEEWETYLTSGCAYGTLEDFLNLKKSELELCEAEGQLDAVDIEGRLEEIEAIQHAIYRRDDVNDRAR